MYGITLTIVTALLGTSVLLPSVYYLDFQSYALHASRLGRFGSRHKCHRT